MTTSLISKAKHGKSHQLLSGRNCPKGSLDEILPVTIRVARSQGDHDQQIIEGITYLCNQMPFPGRTCSSRSDTPMPNEGSIRTSNARSNT